MKALTAAQIADAVGGRLVQGDPDRAFTAVFTDTRKAVPGGLFVALAGPKYDGHDYVAQALDAGAGAAIVEATAGRDGAAAGAQRPPWRPAGARGGAVSADTTPIPGLASDAVLIEVADTLTALQALGSAVRDAHPGKVIAITGSVGKTTVKDMTAAALAPFGKVARTPGNWNNHIGLPLTLCATDGDEAFLVLELGMSAPGEIAALAAIARPDVGVVTSAVAAHLAFFDSVDAIADAKAELFEALADDAVAVANADDPRVLERAQRLHPAPLVTWGVEGADVRVGDVWLTPQGLRAAVEVDGMQVGLQLSALGAHNAGNAAGALAVAYALGYRKLDLRRAAEGLTAFTAGDHRLQLRPAPNGVFVLDDCYNANPASARAALATLAAIAPADAVKGAVLGTMLELGPDAPTLHAGVGRAAADAGVSWLVATGPHADDLARGFHAARGERGKGLAQVTTVADLADAEATVRAFAGPGRWVLLKGSRGQRLERALPWLGATAPAAPAPSTKEAR